jgi:hypothetical protein
MLSSKLGEILVAEYGLTAAAARKRISRAPAGVKRLAYLPFPRNVRFMYLQRDYGSAKFWQALTEALFQGSSSYAGALAALQQRNGVAPKAHFRAACGAPIAQKRHLSPDVIIARLKQAGLVAEFDVPGIGPCVALQQEEPYYEPLLADMRARLVTEAILLKALRTWVRNLGLGSYSKVALRDEGAPPKVGTFHWDLTAPSYVAGLVEWSSQGKPKPGFIACDVLIGSEITASGLAPFVQKCTTLASLRRVGRSLQILVGERFTREALLLAKSKGIIAATPENLFGSEVAAALAELTQVLRDAAIAAVSPERFDQLFNRLGKIEGAAGNLRGALFEFLVADLVRQMYGGPVNLNRIFRSDAGEAAECDVLVHEASRRVRFIECKGYHTNSFVSDEEVTRWLTKRVPLIREQSLKHPDLRRLELHFEFWTTGQLSRESIEKLEHAKKTISPDKYSIGYRNQEGVREFAYEVNDRALIDALEKHFLDHPLSTFDRKPMRKSGDRIRSELDKAGVADILDE